MKKIYYIISCILLLGLCVACHKEEVYTLSIRYNGEYYHQVQGKTILVPEKEVGAIQSVTSKDGMLPQKEYQVNATEENCWIGKKIYVNTGEDVIYVEENEKLESGEVVYECYVKGKQTMVEPTDSLYYPYVTYGGIMWLLDEKVKNIPESYKEAERIYSVGEYYSNIDNATNQYGLLGGEIYVSEEKTDVIYVKSISEAKHEKGIWKCVPDTN